MVKFAALAAPVRCSAIGRALPACIAVTLIAFALVADPAAAYRCYG